MKSVYVYVNGKKHSVNVPDCFEKTLSGCVFTSTSELNNALACSVSADKFFTSGLISKDTVSIQRAKAYYDELESIILNNKADCFDKYDIANDLHDYECVSL